ncbi:hypothetical protein BDP27DRAFT_1336281 [Rhodocollybia butyracea]|uniref:Uncharacterized protein n=1 Tax=Rhodocollybia butyracea TaxID=206335 RepID=A0A9P5PFZ4_9AGAR|nr:hypothetical protein BDP27DRAFT_1336281 [Rhodocollybia butyracea]
MYRPLHHFVCVFIHSPVFFLPWSYPLLNRRCVEWMWACVCTMGSYVCVSSCGFRLLYFYLFLMIILFFDCIYVFRSIFFIMRFIVVVRWLCGCSGVVSSIHGVF